MKTFITTLILLLIAPLAFAQDFQKTNPANPVAHIKTSHGSIYVELFQDQAPKTVANFIGLAEGSKEWTNPTTKEKSKKPFYDGLIFHRVMKNFMIQGGCPLGTGTSGPGYKFDDEINADMLGLDKILAHDEQGNPHRRLLIRSRQAYQQNILMPLARKMGIKGPKDFEAKKEEIKERIFTLTLKEALENMGYKYDSSLKSSPPMKGSLAMANSGPNTNGSQFFINLADTDWLTGRHTVFGKVIGGMDVVEKIAKVKTNNSKPVKPVKIVSIRLVKQK